MWVASPPPVIFPTSPHAKKKASLRQNDRFSVTGFVPPPPVAKSSPLYAFNKIMGEKGMLSRSALRHHVSSIKIPPEEQILNRGGTPPESSPYHSWFPETDGHKDDWKKRFVKSSSSSPKSSKRGGMARNLQQTLQHMRAELSSMKKGRSGSLQTEHVFSPTGFSSRIIQSWADPNNKKPSLIKAGGLAVSVFGFGNHLLNKSLKRQKVKRREKKRRRSESPFPASKPRMFRELQEIVTGEVVPRTRRARTYSPRGRDESSSSTRSVSPSRREDEQLPAHLTRTPSEMGPGYSRSSGKNLPTVTSKRPLDNLTLTFTPLRTDGESSLSPPRSYSASPGAQVASDSSDNSPERERGQSHLSPRALAASRRAFNASRATSRMKMSASKSVLAGNNGMGSLANTPAGNRNSNSSVRQHLSRDTSLDEIISDCSGEDDRDPAKSVLDQVRAAQAAREEKARVLKGKIVDDAEKKRLKLQLELQALDTAHVNIVRTEGLDSPDSAAINAKKATIQTELAELEETIVKSIQSTPFSSSVNLHETIGKRAISDLRDARTFQRSITATRLQAKAEDIASARQRLRSNSTTQSPAQPKRIVSGSFRMNIPTDVLALTEPSMRPQSPSPTAMGKREPVPPIAPPVPPREPIYLPHMPRVSITAATPTSTYRAPIVDSPGSPKFEHDSATPDLSYLARGIRPPSGSPPAPPPAPAFPLLRSPIVSVPSPLNTVAEAMSPAAAYAASAPPGVMRPVVPPLQSVADQDVSISVTRASPAEASMRSVSARSESSTRSGKSAADIEAELLT